MTTELETVTLDDEIGVTLEVPAALDGVTMALDAGVTLDDDIAVTFDTPAALDDEI